MEHYQDKHKNQAKIESISDMKVCVDEIDITKHSTLGIRQYLSGI